MLPAVLEGRGILGHGQNHAFLNVDRRCYSYGFSTGDPEEVVAFQRYQQDSFFHINDLKTALTFFFHCSQHNFSGSMVSYSYC